MDNTEQRTGIDRRIGSALNQRPPFLTRSGRVLYERRTGKDRRALAPAPHPPAAVLAPELG